MKTNFLPYSKYSSKSNVLKNLIYNILKIISIIISNIKISNYLI